MLCWRSWVPRCSRRRAATSGLGPPPGAKISSLRVASHLPCHASLAEPNARIAPGQRRSHPLVFGKGTGPLRAHNIALIPCFQIRVFSSHERLRRACLFVLFELGMTDRNLRYSLRGLKNTFPTACNIRNPRASSCTTRLPYRVSRYCAV